MAFTKQRRRKLIATLIANELFDESARESLTDLTDNQLVALVDADQLDLLVNENLTDNEDEEEDTEEEADDVEDVDTNEDEDVTDNMDDHKSKGGKMTLEDHSDEELQAFMKKRKDKKKMANNRAGNPAEEARAIEEYLSATNAPPVIKRLIANQVAKDEEDRSHYIETITGNESNEFSDTELAEMSTPALARIARLCDNSDDSDYAAASDWSANAGNWSMGANSSGSSVEPLGTVDWSFDNK